MLFSEKNKKNAINLSSAELDLRVVKVKGTKRSFSSWKICKQQYSDGVGRWSSALLTHSE